MPKKKVELLIHTRLQPGDRERREKGKPFKRFLVASLAQFTWLKPGVNETGLIRKNSIARGCPNDSLGKACYTVEMREGFQVRIVSAASNTLVCRPSQRLLSALA